MLKEYEVCFMGEDTLVHFGVCQFCCKEHIVLSFICALVLQ
jgi:hypothetical protein